jgi:hypothetical protein
MPMDVRFRVAVTGMPGRDGGAVSPLHWSVVAAVELLRLWLVRIVSPPLSGDLKLQVHSVPKSGDTAACQ